MASLSVIIPTFNRRDLTIRCVESVLIQKDPIGTEVIVADDGSSDGTVAALKERFAEAIADERLRVFAFAPLGDPGATRNRGASHAQGQHLAFLDSDDYWKPGRLEWLSTLLPRAQLILGADPYPPQTSDWLRNFVDRNWAATSSAVIERKFFGEAGRFSEGYFRPRPGRQTIRGWEDYELWLRCLVILEKRDELARFHCVPEKYVVLEPQAGGAGRMKIAAQMKREVATRVRVLRLLPKRLWPLAARRLAGAAKAILF